MATMGRMNFEVTGLDLRDVYLELSVFRTLFSRWDAKAKKLNKSPAYARWVLRKVDSFIRRVCD